ncbi:MAG TPA: maleylpyruvate isomerase family mycothiol-dependent enzyme [Acidimicrobiia bacterium]
MPDHAASYREFRHRVRGLVAGLDDDQLEMIAPATPEWRVRDVVAHLAGVPADILAGNLDGVTTDAWTARQVDDRRDWPFEEVLRQWEESGAAVEPLVPAFPEAAARQMLADAATHEQDIRGALGTPGARDADALEVGFVFMTGGVSAPLRFETDAGTFPAGPKGEPVATVRADRFELFRAMSGRRSHDQIRAFDWDGEPQPEAVVVRPVFTARADALVE